MRFPSDSPASQARLARAIEKERAARMPKTTRGTPFEDHLRAIGHPSAKPVKLEFVIAKKDFFIGLDAGVGDATVVTLYTDDGGATFHTLTTSQELPRAQEQAALVPGRWEDAHTRPPAIGFYKVAWPEHLEEDHIAYWGGDEWGWMMSPGQEDYAKQYYKAGKRHALGKLQWQSHPTPAERAQSGSWIPWSGGECPVPAGVKVEVRYRDGSQRTGFAMKESGFNEYYWNHGDQGGTIAKHRLDIIAYRPALRGRS